jgi:DNA-binding transcriptional regulator YiaG
MDVLEKAIEKARERKKFPKPAQRRLMREEAGLTLKDMARALRVTQAAVSRWESGDREPSGRLREKYLKVLERLRHEAVTAS